MSSPSSLLALVHSKDEYMQQEPQISEIQISFLSFVAPIFKELKTIESLLTPFFSSGQHSVVVLQQQIEALNNILWVLIRRTSLKFAERVGFWRKNQTAILETFARDATYVELVLQQMDEERRILARMNRKIFHIWNTLDFLHYVVAPLKNIYTKEIKVYRRDIPERVHQIAESIFRGKRWQVGPFVGQGKYGKVCLVIGPDNQPYAFKSFGDLTDLLTLRKGVKTDAVNACDGETFFLQQLGSHLRMPQYICRVENCIIFEFVEVSSFGRSFPTFFDAHYYENVRLYIKQLVKILGYVHSLGILHGDLKPDNILVDLKGILKLIDFGCARLIGTKNYRGAEIFGAPELFVSDFPQKPSSDIWSIGMNLYYLLTRKYLGESFKNSWEIVKLLLKNGQEGFLVRELLPREMPRREEAVDFLEKVLKFDPQKRPQSTQELWAHSYLNERIFSAPSRQELCLPDEGKEPSQKRSRL